MTYLSTVKDPDETPTVVPHFSTETFTKLNKDLLKAASMVTHKEARYLVDSYYQIQDYRIQATGIINMQVKGNAKAKAAGEEGAQEPSELQHWLANNLYGVEKQIKAALGRYADNHPAGRWAQAQIGIGPVIAAGLVAHCNGYDSASSLWRFAGLDPTVVWEKGKKRPWNADLKCLVVFKAGESFVKTCNHAESYYGKLYKKQKEEYIRRNEAGQYREEALKKALKVGKTTDAYKAYSQGMFPPAHIHAMARRYAAKIFLSHFAQVKYEHDFGKALPRPWVLEHGGHKDFIAPPGFVSPLSA